MNTKLKLSVISALAGLMAAPVLAADAPAAPPAPTTLLEAIQTGKPMINFRLRYENVDQDGKTEDSNAWTLRSLVGWQTTPFKNFSFAAQLIGVSPFDHDYNDNDRNISDPRRPNHPLVVDPEDYDVNQLFVEWTGIPDTKLRLGRQSVKLDNVRFIGNVEFRQVMQVMDGLAIENRSLPNTDIYLAHFNKVKLITTRKLDANIDIANIKYKISPSENLVGYGYLVDWDSTTVATANNPDKSSKTFGLRLDGSHKVDEQWKVLYTAEYAKQDDYRNGNPNIDSHYYRFGAGAGYGNWFARVDQELLSSNDGRSAFQTTLGTNHLFQGWADLFLVTPNAGIRDTFITAGGKLFDVTLLAEYHWIDSDEDFRTVGNSATNFTGNQYGTEFDISATYAYDKHWSGKVEYASFHEGDTIVGGTGANARRRDTDKFWLTLMYTF